jgi:nodulation protein A
VRRESELDPDAHGRIASVLRAAFPDYVESYRGRRSWAGARPELRVLAHDDAGVAAHAGVLRRFIQVVDGDQALEQLVAAVGMVAVRPGLHGLGIGKQLGSHLAEALHSLAVPFGLLGCRDEVAGYYRSVGWHSLPPTRSLYCPVDIHDPSRVVASREGWMVLPVTAPLDHWPAGDLFWNGALV